MEKFKKISNKYSKKSAFYAMSESRGITLIVLIITIVVLIILAGVTISNITSDEGVLKEASYERDKAKKVSLQEQLSLIAMNADTSKGELDINSVKNSIQEKIEGATITNNSYPLIVDVGDDRFFVNEDGTASEWGYERKEFIKSTGTQYIDTGVNAANTIDFEITLKTDVDSMTVSNTGRNMFFGARNKDVNRVLLLNFGAINTQKEIYTWKNKAFANGDNLRAFSTSIYNPQNKITISCINDIWKVNDNTTATSDSVGTWKDINNTIIVFGFSNYDNSQKTIYPFYENMYLYSLKIWDNGKLVRDYIPVISLEKNYEGEACLFDSVDHKFYYNQGTGTFVTN